MRLSDVSFRVPLGDPNHSRVTRNASSQPLGLYGPRGWNTRNGFRVPYFLMPPVPPPNRFPDLGETALPPLLRGVVLPPDSRLDLLPRHRDTSPSFSPPSQRKALLCRLGALACSALAPLLRASPGPCFAPTKLCRAVSSPYSTRPCFATAMLGFAPAALGYSSTVLHPGSTAPLLTSPKPCSSLPSLNQHLTPLCLSTADQRLALPVRNHALRFRLHAQLHPHLTWLHRC